MMNKLKALVVEEQGQGMTEYGLVLGVIAIATIGALLAFRDQIAGLFEKATTTVETAKNSI
ncbi:MAG: Flp family type IVb pilin [Bacillaceae bacterium]|nr:Flp family type IVb pilin [Bacillaceae bacterium]